MGESCALRLGIEALRPARRVKKARDPWTSGELAARHGGGHARLGN